MEKWRVSDGERRKRRVRKKKNSNKMRDEKLNRRSGVKWRKTERK